jgi:hypothetical protein
MSMDQWFRWGDDVAVAWETSSAGMQITPRTMEKLSENIQCRLMFVW